MTTSPSLIFCSSPMYGLKKAVCLIMFVMASSEFVLPGPGLGHHHARFGYFWLTPYLELNYSTTEIDPSSNWIINRQEPSLPQEHDTDASWQFRTSKKLIPIAVKLGSMMVLCFRRTLYWGPQGSPEGCCYSFPCWQSQPIGLPLSIYKRKYIGKDNSTLEFIKNWSELPLGTIGLL